jgi:hypothetical protein
MSPERTVCAVTPSYPEYVSIVTRAWRWFIGRRPLGAYYPDEEPKTRAERSHETVGWADRATWGEGSRSTQKGPQQPFQ